MWGGLHRSQVASTLHWTAKGGSDPTSCGGKADKAHGHVGVWPPALKPAVDFSRDYHLFEVLWSPHSLVFAVDGHQIGSLDSSQTLIPQTPFYLIFNTAVCGAKYCQVKHKGELVPSPVRMFVDYVRVYEQVLLEAA